MILKLDHREDPKFITIVKEYPWKEKLPNHEVFIIVEELKEGDFQILDGEDQILGCYERKNKETNDLMNSIYDQRIFDECERVANSGAPYFGLVKEGQNPPLDDEREEEKRKNVEFGTDLSLTRDHHIHIEETSSMKDTVKFIERLIFKAGHTPAAKHKAQKKNVTPQEWTDAVLRMLFTEQQWENIQAKYQFYDLNLNTIVSVLRGATPIFTNTNSDGSIDLDSLKQHNLKDFTFSWKPRENSGIVDLSKGQIKDLGPVSIRKAICRLMQDPTYCDVENLRKNFLGDQP